MIFNFEDTKKLYADFPKSTRAFGEHIASMVSDDLSNFSEEDRDQLAQSSLVALTRLLYDLFDKNNIIIQMHYFDGSWTVSVDDMNNGMDYPSRIEAEKEAFLEAFKMLEEKLTSTTV